MWNLKAATKTATLLAMTIGLSGCGGDTSSGFATANLLRDIQTEMKSWNMTSEAKKAYPGLSPEEATKTYARKMMHSYFRKTESSEKRELMAAMVYLGYAQLNTHARPAYCNEMNVNISSFSKKFADRHQKEDQAVNMILAKHKLTSEKIWEKNKRQSRVIVKNDLMRAAGLRGTYALCSDIKSNPQKYANSFNFKKTMPGVAVQLNQATAPKPVTKHAEVGPAPALRR